MCFDPVSLTLLAASTAASAGGSILEGNAQSDFVRQNLDADMTEMRQSVEEARLRNEVADRYRETARKFGEENQTNFNAGLGSFMPDAQAARMDAATADRGGTVASAIGQPPSAEATPFRAGTPDAVKATHAQRVGDAFARAQTQGAAGAKVGAYGDTMAENQRTVGGTGQKIETVNTLAKGNAALLPHEQDLVGYQARKPIFRPAAPQVSPWAPVLKGAGRIGGAMAGGGMFGGSPTLGSYFPGSIDPLVGGITPTGLHGYQGPF